MVETGSKQQFYVWCENRRVALVALKPRSFEYRYMLV
jgi:hypothetical protein